MEEEIIKISPDRERAKSIIYMAATREQILKNIDKKKFASFAVESYYEIIKELITVVMLLDGFKTLSHKKLIEYIESNYKDKFKGSEIELMDKLRTTRNKITYEGFFVEEHFLMRKESEINDIIEKLRKIARGKIGEN